MARNIFLITIAAGIALMLAGVIGSQWAPSAASYVTSESH